MADLTIRPFEVHVPDEDLAELQRRVAATRRPGKELVEDRSQGVQLATIQALVTCWGTGYDWRMCEARLNALPQFVTEIDMRHVVRLMTTKTHAPAGTHRPGGGRAWPAKTASDAGTSVLRRVTTAKRPSPAERQLGAPAVSMT
jgi:hypothetical protein